MSEINPYDNPYSENQIEPRQYQPKQPQQYQPQPQQYQPQQPQYQQPHYQPPQYQQPHYQPPQYQQPVAGYPAPTIYPQPAPYVVTGYPVQKVAYVLLAFFLGNLGAHHFYSNKIGIGVVYLLFSWTLIPGIIAFIEAIIALVKPSDIYGNIYV